MGRHVLKSRNLPGASPGNSLPVSDPKPLSLSPLPQCFRRQTECNLGSADVAGFLDHLRHRERTFRVRIVDSASAHRQHTAYGIDDRSRFDLARFQRRRDGERLHGGTRLELVGHGMVAQYRHVGLVAIIGVVGRPVRQRQHLAGLGIQHHDGAAFGFAAFDRLLDLAEGQRLYLAVYAQRNIAARLGRAQTGHVLDDISAPVLDDLLAARLAAELCLQRKLDAFLSVVIHIGEADEMRGDFAAGIVAAIFALQRNAGDSQLDHLGRLLRRQLALEIDEFARGIGELALHLGRAQSDDLRQIGNLRGGNFDIARTRPHRFHRRADCQRFAMAIRDHAAMRMDINDAAVTRIAFLLQEVVVDALQIDRRAPAA